VIAPHRHPISSRGSADCRHCLLEARCWSGLEPGNGPIPVVREAAVRSGDFLWRPGDLFTGPVIVHSGCVMIFRVTPGGEEQVLQFALAGDLVGLEALARGHHDQYAQAQGEVLSCRVRCSTAGRGGETSALDRELLLRASNMLAAAQQRRRPDDPTLSVLEFLRDVGRRVGREEISSGQRRLQVRLPMSRLDIGHYLGFAEETVCRAIRRLRDQGLIEARGRQISLLEAAWR
jgi:CRP/FNR family transcriptional regulator